MCIDIGNVSHVIPFVLEPANHGVFHRCSPGVAEKIPAPAMPGKPLRVQEGVRMRGVVGRINPVGTVQRDTRHIQSILIDVVEREALSSTQRNRSRPWIVSLVSDDRLLENQVGASGVAYSERDVTFFARIFAMESYQ